MRPRPNASLKQGLIVGQDHTKFGVPGLIGTNVLVRSWPTITALEAHFLVLIRKYAQVSKTCQST